MNEINEIFSKGNLLKDKEIFEEFSELQSKKIEKSTGMIEKEENLLNLVFVTDKIMKIANNIKLEKCDIILEKDKKNIKEEEIEKIAEKEIGY